jgi:hypothetical protein
MSPPNITKDGLGDNMEIWLMMALSTVSFTGCSSVSPRLSAKKTKRNGSSDIPTPDDGTVLSLHPFSIVTTTISNVTAMILIDIFLKTIRCFVTIVVLFVISHAAIPSAAAIAGYLFISDIL